MTDYQQYLDPRVLAKLEGLEFRARMIVEGFVSGAHRSPYHGFSVEFAEHREYVAGDDLRYVDWKVFGKTDKYYLKQYEQETNLISYLLLDTSESMQYQSEDAPLSKLEYAKCTAASLAYLILNQQDSVGLVTFDNEVRSIIRPGSNASHLKQLAHTMSETSPQRKSKTGAILHDLAERLKKRGIVMIFSDLFDDVAGIMAGLKHFRHRRYEVILFHVLDPAEIDFPFSRVMLFKGLEGWSDVVAEPRSLRKAYLAEFQKFLHAVQAGSREQHVDYVQLRTDQPLDIGISSYLARRTSRV